MGRSFGRDGSCVSVQGLARLGSVFSMSVLDFLHLGSSLSLRSLGRLSSSVSVQGLARFGSVFSMSVLDFLHLGSSLSLRSFARLGCDLSLSGAMKFGGASTYIRCNSGIEMTVGGNVALTATSSGGTLSGAWSSETTISTSDRRLKKDIEPLEDVLKGLSPSEEGVNWVLRELRPVAFRFK